MGISSCMSVDWAASILYFFTWQMHMRLHVHYIQNLWNLHKTQKMNNRIKFAFDNTYFTQSKVDCSIKSSIVNSIPAPRIAQVKAS